ncbi:MAG: PorV/PorQ family protein [Calditrichota bacterium]
MRTLTVAVLLAVLTTTTFATSAGTTGFELFRTDGFARNSALGGSQIAVGGDLHSLYSNPAGLSEIQQPMGSVGFFKHVLDINSGNLAYARPVPKIGVIGAAITYFDYGKFDRANEYGQRQGEFGASDFLMTVSAARGLRPGLSGGMSLKYLNSTIDSYSASAIAADFGILYQTGYYDWNVGAGAYNLGFATSAYLEEKDDLPTYYRLGLSAPLEHLPVRFSVAGDYAEADGIRGAAGLEITFSPYLQGRIGYNTIGIDQRVGLDRDALAGFSGGVGIHVKTISFDYALTSQGEVGFLHRFVLGTTFPTLGSSH